MSSLLTGELVLRNSFDPVAGALKTVPSTETSFAVSLNHLEDSVTTRPATITLNPNTEYSAVGFSRICLYGEGTLEVSPTETGDNFQTVTANALEVVNICAIRVKCSVTAVMGS